MGRDTGDGEGGQYKIWNLFSEEVIDYCYCYYYCACVEKSWRLTEYIVVEDLALPLPQFIEIGSKKYGPIMKVSTY